MATDGLKTRAVMRQFGQSLPFGRQAQIGGQTLKTRCHKFAVKRHDFLLAFFTRAPKLRLTDDEVGNQAHHRGDKQNAQPCQRHPMILLVIQHTQGARKRQHRVYQYQGFRGGNRSHYWRNPL